MGKCESCKKEKKSDSKASFHRFPVDSIMSQIWTKNMGKEGFHPRKDSVLCSEHFHPVCFNKKFNRVFLKKGSVPTVFKDRKVVVDAPLIRIHDTRYSDKKDVEHLIQGDMVCRLQSDSPVDLHIVQKSKTNDDVSQEEISDVQSVPSPKEAIKSVRIPKKTLDGSNIRHWREVLQHDHHYYETPYISRKKLDSTRKQLENMRRSNKALKEQIKRLQKTVKSLKGVIKQSQGAQPAKKMKQKTLK